MLGNFACFFFICGFFFFFFFKFNIFRNTIRVSNSLDPDQVRGFVGERVKGPFRIIADDCQNDVVCMLLFFSGKIMFNIPCDLFAM